MKTPVYGKNKILLFRVLKDAASKTAAKLALQTTHRFTYSRSANTTATKDGTIVTSNGLVVILDITAVASNDETNTMLKKAVESGEKLEVWEVDISAAPQAGKYPAVYARGSLENWEVPADVEGTVTFTTKMNIDGKPVSGLATVDPAILAEIESAYAFVDTTVSG